MGIYIKGMKMPESCEECVLSSTDSSGFFGCHFTRNIVLRKREQVRPNWCPITEIPPHGRLIDADALNDELEERYEEAKKWFQEAADHDTRIRAESCIATLVEAILTLSVMPTIIEAEVK